MASFRAAGMPRRARLAFTVASSSHAIVMPPRLAATGMMDAWPIRALGRRHRAADRLQQLG